MTGALLGEGPLRLAAAERERLLALARHRYRRCAEAGLRDGTAEFGPVREEYVEDGEDDVARLTLGCLTVRAGHGAVLTEPERAARDALLVLVADGDPRVRRGAGRVLIVGDDGSREFADALAVLLRDPERAVRRDTAACTAAYGRPSRGRGGVTSDGAALSSGRKREKGP
ncbi:hypothetical protein AB0469_18405 [Streptomyces sp. NPDC093801]|uniref:hypothetical protein n=1 Tax=Streptomyces sp. NPDC093801 TaxID=3155203 RepID=UPI00344E53A5